MSKENIYEVGIKMRWSEVYSKCNKKKFCQITQINGEVKLFSDFNNFLKSNSKLLTIVSVMFLCLILYTYKFNLNIILAAILLIVFLIVTIIYYNTYSIVSKGDKLILHINFQDIEIDYSNLLNIFISRSKSHLLLFIPFYTYNLNLIFVKDDEQMMLSLSTIMLNKKDVLKFFKNFEFEVLPEQKKEEKRIKDEQDTKKAIIVTAVIVIVASIIVSMIVVGIKASS